MKQAKILIVENVDFMDKPVDVDELIGRINDFLKEK